MNSEKVERSADLPKFNNSSDPRQRLNAMVYVSKRFPFGQTKGRTKQKSDDRGKDRLARRIIATFATPRKKALAAFGLDPKSVADREVLLGILSWVLYGKTASRGRPPSQDEIVEEIRKKIGPELEKNPKMSNAALGKVLRKAPGEMRRTDTLRKLAGQARTRLPK